MEQNPYWEVNSTLVSFGNSLHCVEPEGSFPILRELTMWTELEPFEFTAHPSTFSVGPILILSSHPFPSLASDRFRLLCPNIACISLHSHACYVVYLTHFLDLFTQIMFGNKWKNYVAPHYVISFSLLSLCPSPSHVLQISFFSFLKCVLFTHLTLFSVALLL